VLSNVLSIISLFVATATAIFAVYVTRGISNREVTSAIIAEYYSSMRSLTEVQLQQWQLAHLFETARNYPAVVNELRQVAPPTDDIAAQTRLRLNERAVALQLFGAFEHVVYQLNNAERARDRSLAQFLRDAEDYFTTRLLVNPRLIYLWAPEGGNLEDEFELDVRQRFRAAVPVAEDVWDAIGPYG
jgi:hypothetical protein